MMQLRHDKGVDATEHGSRFRGGLGAEDSTQWGSLLGPGFSLSMSKAGLCRRHPKGSCFCLSSYRLVMNTSSSSPDYLCRQACFFWLLKRGLLSLLSSGM